MMFFESQLGSQLLFTSSWWAAATVSLDTGARQIMGSGDWETSKLNDNPTRQRKGTLQGTNVSHQKSLLKMIFLFPRWDMLILWGVLECAISKATTDHYYRNHYLSSYLSYSYADAYSESYSELIFIFIFIFIGCIILFSYAYHIQSNCGAYG